ncbi:MAG: ABC transporter permease [Flavobacterium sp. MedPE-SWcel]|uniref:ABC transporter permease n=1 Tax=uncultured Flavobacterium sp. TaxID=165435 RepID=UPI00091AD799|nr:ABC transporter permease [uncultured Flavobacterium sp.]OIQ16211.1 MAG: ABC transporter permease [Flavobacterium sp. MedPE-SWcel]
MSLSLIIKREFNSKVRNKSFIVMTFLSPILVVAMGTLVAYLANINNDVVNQIAIHDTASLLKTDFEDTDNVKYTDLSEMSLEMVKKEVSENESYEGLIYVPQTDDITELVDKVEYISTDSPNLDFVSNMERVVNDKLTKHNLKELGFDYDKIENAKTKATIHFSKFSGEETFKEGSIIKIVIGGVFGYLIMMFVIIYGNMVMRSVIEEKTNRIIEIIISSVKPFKLMMGKIIGTSFAGVLQFLIWTILGLGLFFILSNVFGVQVGAASAQPEAAEMSREAMNDAQLYISEVLKLPLFTIFISFIVYFIGGFFLYSSLYAAIGAAVDSETDSQQFLFPIIMPLMLGVYVGFFTVISDPHGTVATIFSMIPLTSPIVMMMRIPFGVPVWQLILSMTILFGTFFGVVWFAAKIYRIGILMYGKKPTYKELFKWLKY